MTHEDKQFLKLGTRHIYIQKGPPVKNIDRHFSFIFNIKEPSDFKVVSDYTLKQEYAEVGHLGNILYT